VIIGWAAPLIVPAAFSTEAPTAVLDLVTSGRENEEVAAWELVLAQLSPRLDLAPADHRRPDHGESPHPAVRLVRVAEVVRLPPPVARAVAPHSLACRAGPPGSDQTESDRGSAEVIPFSRRLLRHPP
jgi:hypothetical protein